MQKADVEDAHSVAQLASNTGQVAGAVKHVRLTVAYAHPTTFSSYYHLLVSTWCVSSSGDKKGTGAEFS